MKKSWGIYKKTLKTKRGLVWLILAAVLSFAGIGVAYALNTHEISKENDLKSRGVSVEVVEVCPDKTITLDEEKTKEVAFKNVGSSPVFLRMAWSETWEHEGAWLQDDGSRCEKNWTADFENDWILIDGWYYYKKVLPAGATTENVLESVKFPIDLDEEYSTGAYSLDFLAEVVQLSDEAAVNTLATQTVFGKKATVAIISTESGAVTAGTVAWSDVEES